MTALAQNFEKAYAAYAYARSAWRNPAEQRPDCRHRSGRKMPSMLFETGHPWITFKDACNVRSPNSMSGGAFQQSLHRNHANTSDDETAVCNLGSISLHQHLAEGNLDHAKAAAHDLHRHAHAG